VTYLEDIAKRIKQAVALEAVPSSDGEALFLLYALLAQVKGQRTTARDVHDAWTVWMQLRGESRPAMVRFDELPSRVRALDHDFAMVIRRAAEPTAAVPFVGSGPKAIAASGDEGAGHVSRLTASAAIHPGGQRGNNGRALGCVGVGRGP